MVYVRTMSGEVFEVTGDRTVAQLKSYLADEQAAGRSVVFEAVPVEGMTTIVNVERVLIRWENVAWIGKGRA